jgi:uncharacterized protein YuzE
MRVYYDPRYDILELKFYDEAPELVARQVDEDIVFDFGAGDRLFGMEILGASGRVELARLLSEKVVVEGPADLENRSERTPPDALRVYYDDKHDILYIEFDERSQKRLSEQFDEDIVLDFGEGEKLVAMEILGASHRINLAGLLSGDVRVERPERATAGAVSGVRESPPG